MGMKTSSIEVMYHNGMIGTSILNSSDLNAERIIKTSSQIFIDFQNRLEQGKESIQKLQSSEEVTIKQLENSILILNKIAQSNMEVNENISQIRQKVSGIEMAQLTQTKEIKNDTHLMLTQIIGVKEMVEELVSKEEGIESNHVKVNEVQDKEELTHMLIEMSRNDLIQNEDNIQKAILANSEFNAALIRSNENTNKEISLDSLGSVSHHICGTINEKLEMPNSNIMVIQSEIKEVCNQMKQLRTIFEVCKMQQQVDILNMIMKNHEENKQKMEDYERNAMSFFNTTIQTMTNLKAVIQGEMTSIPLIFSGAIDQIGQNTMKIF
jgi:hypothetical protein